MTEKRPGIFGRIAGALATPQKSTALSWQPSKQPYPRLIGFDARALAGQEGLYLLWHLGVRPQWLRAGYSSDLGAAATLLARTPEFAAFAPHDGPFLSWSACVREDAPGLVNFLIGRLNPCRQDLGVPCDLVCDSKAEPISCTLPPGTKDVHLALNIHAHRN
ncbi:MAG: hypothetical protein AB7E79_11960 [Rhodospirillaceae bacterium]